MYRGRRALGLIPARGGSKGLPRKNVLPFAGKPLIEWTIAGALGSQLLDRTVVTTDSDEIAEISRIAGAEVPFMRPAELATDNATSVDVALHALDFFKRQRGEDFDFIALLQPTSPLRSSSDIDGAIRALADNEDGAQALVSIVASHGSHPAFAKRVDSEGFIRPLFGQMQSTGRRQDLPPAFAPCGVIFLCEVGVLAEYRTFYPEMTLAYSVPEWKGREIDDLYDFIGAEAIARYLDGTGGASSVGLPESR